jgi:hypothetical protein
MAPIQERRAALAREKDLPHDVLSDGARRARAVISETVARAKEFAGLSAR